MSKRQIDIIKKNNLCVGCGICECQFKHKVFVSLNKEGKYTIEKHTLTEADDKVFEKLCPVLTGAYSDRIWGEYIEALFAYSKNNDVRYRCSSGGIVTEVLIYLIENNFVDAILHVGVSSQTPLTSCAYISTNREEVIKNAGSRYSPVKLLSYYDEIIENYNRIAIVGKACDLRAINNYMKNHHEVENKSIYTISIFCGGIPSQNATYRILDMLKVKEKDIARFQYRGNGWPGLTMAECKDGKQYSMTYNQAWGEILGRDIHRFCKFCPDGLGELADISCGDAWYSTENGYPDFQEHDGRSIILCRSQVGKKIIDRMAKDKVIYTERINDADSFLQKVQIGQYFRKTSLWGKHIAAKICNINIPHPSMKKLWSWHGDKSLIQELKISLGTLKRIIKGNL